jgi:hypothetical protein
MELLPREPSCEATLPKLVNLTSLHQLVDISTEAQNIIKYKARCLQAPLFSLLVYLSNFKLILAMPEQSNRPQIYEPATGLNKILAQYLAKNSPDFVQLEAVRKKVCHKLRASSFALSDINLGLGKSGRRQLLAEPT